MKNPLKYILVMVAAMAVLSPVNSFAQGAGSEIVTVKKSDLPADLVARLESQQKVAEVRQTLQVASEFAGIGKEIGVAVNEGLGAVTDQTAKFADTTPGKFTMFLIAWKVMAQDSLTLTNSILGVVVGIPFLIFANCFLIWIWKRTTTPVRLPVPKKKPEDEQTYEEALTWFLKADDDSDSRSWFIGLWWVAVFVANIWIIAGVIF